MPSSGAHFFSSQKNHLMLSSEKFHPPAPSPSGDGAIFKAVARKKSFHLSIDNYSFKHVFNFQFSIDFNKATDIKLNRELISTFDFLNQQASEVKKSLSKAS